jgi:hypothetical protein
MGFGAAPSVEAGPDYEVVTPRPGQSVEDAVAELAARSDVVLAQPNWIYHGLLVPNDTSYPSQYHLPLIRAPEAWEITRGSASETIAIIDSGADTNTIDLGPRIVKAPGVDIIDGDMDASDTPSGSSHGTRVAAVAAAATNNGINVAGIDWFSNLLLVRVLSGAGATGTSIDIDSGLRAAIRHKATVINLSLGFSTSTIDSLIESRLVEAENANIIVVAAAGNDGTSPVIYPASSTRAIGVGASTSADARASFSNYGAATGLTGIDVMAPGQSVVTLGFSDAVVTASGTSFSAPVVSAAAALVRSLRPGITPAQFLRFLRSTARDIGDPGYDDFTGAGRIDLMALISAACANTNYGDSLAAADARTAPMVTGGRQGHAALYLNTADSWAGFFQRHSATRGTIQFYWMPDSTQPSDTRFILTQRGNAAHSSGNLDLIHRTDGKLEYRLQDSGAIVSSTILNAGQWYQIAVTWGESGMILWVNGESEVSRAVSGGPPLADTLYLGAPSALGSAQSARGRFDALAFGSTQQNLFPKALFARVESQATATTEVGTVKVGWKSFATETNAVTIDVYADTDQTGFNGTLLASGLANDENESASLAPLTIGNAYYIALVATDATTTSNNIPERAYAYGAAAILNAAPPAVSVSAATTGSSGGGCLLTRLPWGWAAGGRAWRDLLLESVAGRVLASAYYALFA